MGDASEGSGDKKLARVQSVLGAGIPHNDALGITFSSFGEGRAEATLPYDERFVGNPETGVLHGGVITALLDATCGGAVFAKIMGARQARIATLDLRIDYLRPATPRERIRCRAECYKVTKHMAFVRGVAFHEDDSDPIASAAGSFMVFGPEPAREPAPGEPPTSGGDDGRNA
jgi:uncharacterized protein (TIGR00369 family)